MVDDIKLNEFPKEAGVYKIIWFGNVIYVGSSNDLYQRMGQHRSYIKKGSNHGYQKGFYLFLQNNPFTVQFELTEKYRQKEQELIDEFEPIYNELKAYTGMKPREYKKEYNKQWRETHKEELKQYYESHKEELKQYYENNKEELKQYCKQYNNQKCNYNGETLTLNALAKRFRRQGIKHSTQEAKKYLIS